MAHAVACAPCESVPDRQATGPGRHRRLRDARRDVSAAQVTLMLLGLVVRFYAPTGIGIAGLCPSLTPVQSIIPRRLRDLSGLLQFFVESWRRRAAPPTRHPRRPLTSGASCFRVSSSPAPVAGTHRISAGPGRGLYFAAGSGQVQIVLAMTCAAVDRPAGV
ncbi:hypothetical protein NDU88_011229 [Pleurodeles waltl]|uniref:Uncharacterized protein n=1 Tax=Pleurodeles waltl TaxID=8319 RepID=A0AAV7Q438_PLEWA|nr:hypothetical protein NDU88_011229 [Pleurodeles waltl]